MLQGAIWTRCMTLHETSIVFKYNPIMVINGLLLMAMLPSSCEYSRAPVLMIVFSKPWSTVNDIARAAGIWLLG